ANRHGRGRWASSSGRVMLALTSGSIPRSSWCRCTCRRSPTAGSTTASSSATSSISRWWIEDSARRGSAALEVLAARAQDQDAHVALFDDERVRAPFADESFLFLHGQVGGVDDEGSRFAARSK